MKKDRKKLGKYDWRGSCDPANMAESGMINFSVGVFQWIKGKTKPLVRGPVKLRIVGNTSNPQPVYDAAETWCDWMNKGRMPDFKTLNMGWSK